MDESRSGPTWLDRSGFRSTGTDRSHARSARLDQAAGRALFALALTDPETNTAYRQGRAALTGAVRDLLGRAVPGRDADWVARTCRDLLGTLDEVGTDLLLGDLSPEQARELVRDRVADATGG